jgi:hypothetical protein
MPPTGSLFKGLKSPAGELAERSNAAVLKTASPEGLGGSNPSLSAKENKAVVDGSLAHFGRYTIDEKDKSITFCLPPPEKPLAAQLWLLNSRECDADHTPNLRAKVQCRGTRRR